MSRGAEAAAVLPLIRVFRGYRVVLDFDLARLYGVSTSRLNQQVRRNQRRFPRDFAFPLTRSETASKLLRNATASRHRNLRKPPVAYTEHGAVMAANVLHSERAVRMSVEVVRAFILLRRVVLSHGALANKLAELERAVKTKLERHDQKIDALFQALEDLLGKREDDGTPKKRIGFVWPEVCGRT